MTLLKEIKIASVWIGQERDISLLGTKPFLTKSLEIQQLCIYDRNRGEETFKWKQNEEKERKETEKGREAVMGRNANPER